MSILSNVGAKCFTKMFDEFRAAYEIAKSFYGSEIKSNEVINIAFLILYNGVGATSNILNRNILKNTHRLDELLAVFDGVSSLNWTGSYPIESEIMHGKKIYNIKYDKKSLSDLGYHPFEGHTTLLGQYFRNLFHILSYTTESVDATLLSKEEKYELIKSLRSQLSSYEQILIYFNSLSIYGKPLQEKGFINDYKLIKNIPVPLVEFAGDIHEYYPEIIFEWDEIMDRAAKYQ